MSRFLCVYMADSDVKSLTSLENKARDSRRVLASSPQLIVLWPLRQYHGFELEITQNP